MPAGPPATTSATSAVLAAVLAPPVARVCSPSASAASTCCGISASHDDTDATINSTTRRGSLTAAAAAAADASTSNDKGQTSQSRCAAVGVRTKHTKVGAQVCPEQNDRDDLGAQGGAGGGFSLARRQYRFAKVGNGLGQLTSSPEN
jgi:hypothetical protein